MTIRNVQQVATGTPADEVNGLTQADGDVILKGLFAKQVDRLYDEIDSIVKEWVQGIVGNDWMKEFAGYKTKRVTQLIARSKAFREEMLDDPTMLSYVDKLMLDTSDSYWMNAAQVIQLQPGEKTQFLHRDLEDYPIFRAYGPKGLEVMCNCIIVLSDYTEEMGATRVIPGSHKWEDFENRGDPSQTVAAVMEKGNAMLFAGKLLHGAGEIEAIVLVAR